MASQCGNCTHIEKYHNYEQRPHTCCTEFVPPPDCDNCGTAMWNNPDGRGHLGWRCINKDCVVDSLRAQLAKAEARVEELEKIRAWYADMNNWEQRPEKYGGIMSKTDVDLGQRARKEKTDE